MGQPQLTPQPLQPTKRIQPTPGSSGSRNRRGTVSVYSEITSSIYTLRIIEGMTVKDLKSLLPTKHCDLKLENITLSDDLPLDSISIDQSTLIRMVLKDTHSYKTSSTADSMQEQEIPKTFGPKQLIQEKIERPNSDSLLSSSASEDKQFNLFLKAIAVPDIVLKVKNERKEGKKKDI